MAEIGRMLVALGLLLCVVGGGAWLLGRAGAGSLPGDIVYRTDGVRVYFPIVACIVLSVLLTLAVWAWNSLRGR